MIAGNNAAFRGMQNNEARMTLASSVGPGSNLNTVASKEKNLLLENQQNWLMYRINLYRQDAHKKQLDENIKRSFSTFG